MPYFAVIREAGPAWADGGIAAQPAVEDHAAFMSALAEEGLVLFAGPLAGSERGRLRVLLIISAEDEEQIHRRLAADPWTISERLQIKGVEAWNVFVGADRLPAPVVGSPGGAGGARQARLSRVRPGATGARSGAR
jgi:uncharacterized protein YciI